MANRISPQMKLRRGTVIQEKPRRGREMVTKDVPDDILDEMRLVSAKRTLRSSDELRAMLKERREGKVEPYYEGYIGDQRYLVPDRDLAAMKTLVDTRTKRRTTDNTYVREQSPETDEETFRRYNERFERMYRRFRLFESPSISEAEPEIEPQKIPKKRKRRRKRANLRFLISGHFRENKLPPIWIIQRYYGNSLLRSKNPNLVTKQTEQHVDIFVSGKYYKQSILEEENGKIASFKTKPKIKINKQCNIYEHKFLEVFNSGDFNVELGGKYIHDTRSKLYTPFVQIGVSKNDERISRGHVRFNEDALYTKAYVSTPLANNPFGEGLPYAENDRLDKVIEISEVSPAGIGSGDVLNPPIPLLNNNGPRPQTTNQHVDNLKNGKNKSSFKKWLLGKRNKERNAKKPKLAEQGSNNNAVGGDSTINAGPSNLFSNSNDGVNKNSKQPKKTIFSNPKTGSKLKNWVTRRVRKENKPIPPTTSFGGTGEAISQKSKISPKRNQLKKNNQNTLNNQLIQGKQRLQVAKLLKTKQTQHVNQLQENKELIDNNQSGENKGSKENKPSNKCLESKVRKQPKECKLSKTNKRSKENKQLKESKQPEESKQSKEGGQPKESKHSKEDAQPKERKQSKEGGQPKESKQSKEGGQPKERKQSKEGKQSNESKQPKDIQSSNQNTKSKQINDTQLQKETQIGQASSHEVEIRRWNYTSVTNQPDRKTRKKSNKSAKKRLKLKKKKATVDNKITPYLRKSDMPVLRLMPTLGSIRQMIFNFISAPDQNPLEPNRRKVLEP